MSWNCYIATHELHKGIVAQIAILYISLLNLVSKFGAEVHFCIMEGAPLCQGKQAHGREFGLGIEGFKKSYI